MKRVWFLLIVVIFMVSCQEIRTYHLEDGVKKECEIKNDQFNGKCKFYDKDGVLLTQTDYVNNLKHGTMTKYFPSGKPKEVRTYVNDQLNGETKEYYENGELKAKAFFQKGLQDGVMKEYYKDGTLKATQIYRMGIPHGKYETFYSNGELEFSAVLLGDTTLYYNEYDSLGNWIEENRFFEINYPDTVTHGDEVELRFKLHGPVFKSEDSLSFDVVVYDSVLNRLLDESKEPVLNNEVKYTFKANARGRIAFAAYFLADKNNKKRKEYRVSNVEIWVRDQESL